VAEETLVEKEGEAQTRTSGHKSVRKKFLNNITDFQIPHRQESLPIGLHKYPMWLSFSPNVDLTALPNTSVRMMMPCPDIAADAYPFLDLERNASGWGFALGRGYIKILAPKRKLLHRNPATDYLEDSQVEDHLRLNQLIIQVSFNTILHVL
jgi:hypothetical protein